ncbi:MAG: GDP-mannose dehydrogenase [Candidatus Bathyarchaeota archaeon]|nr:GDP-mannose dehydrogenase [Candidatus Bathyarchaeota archaeon]
MTKEAVLIVGLGEVGRPLYEILKASGKFTVYGFDLSTEKMQALGQTRLPNKPADIMHICIPCSSQTDFIEAAESYVRKHKPKLVIINSTVVPGTTMMLHERANCLVAHSPVRGVHKSLEHMKRELENWTKYIGGATEKAGKAAQLHFKKAGFKTKVLKSCRETELAKLFETTYRAWMISCFHEMHRISRHFGADFDQVVDFLDDTHRTLLNRPVMFPDVIGGHCLIPNTRLLLKSYDSEFLRLILESNEKRKEDVRNREVVREIEKVKKRVEDFERKRERENKALF